MANEVREGYHIERPNRGKAASKATKAVVILLLLVSGFLMFVVLLGGWSRLAGMQVVLIGYILVYIVMAYYTARWNRGVLPIAAALAIILGIFAAISGPEWFNRDKEGFSSPTLDESFLGLITLLIIPVQLLLIAFSMRGFQQEWNVEVEVPDGQHYHEGMHFDDEGSRPATA
jgi:protein-S-isoprenylcysteine O-methyltransferase Ste14